MGKDFGGRILFRLSNGMAPSLRGTFNINVGGQTNEAVTNQDGSVSRTAVPKAPTCDFNFEDNGLDQAALMKSPRFNVTVIEEFAGVTHYFTNAFVVGDPQSNRQTGEITGLTIAAELYSKA